MPSLHIVMYHYVRRSTSRFPTLKMLKWDDFSRQLDYLQNSYAMVTMEQVVDSAQGGRRLPENACLLTFDDGYQEHYTEVFPELYRRGLSGAFFPPVCALQREHLLEVNKIQLILALNESRMPEVLARIKIMYEIGWKSHTQGFERTYEELYTTYAKPSRFDGKEIAYTKTLLQFALPANWRTVFIDTLFQEFVGIDERVIANEYYMSEDMLTVMVKNGMHVGSHGAKHLWLGKLSPEEQQIEVDASLEMLRAVYGTNALSWTMCYPFGSFNESLRSLCIQRGCVLGVTTEPRVADLGTDDLMALPRRDTNDYSKTCQHDSKDLL